jgi:hypothetical protein
LFPVFDPPACRGTGRLRGVKRCFRFLIRPLAAERGFCASLVEGTSGAVARRSEDCRQIRGQIWRRLPFRFESTRQVASAVGSRNAQSPGPPATLEQLEALAHYVQRLADLRPIRLAFEPRGPRPVEANSQVMFFRRKRRTRTWGRRCSGSRGTPTSCGRRISARTGHGSSTGAMMAP